MKAPTFNDVLVVGMHFRGAQVKSMVQSLVPPFVLSLRREPENPHDPNAVMVFYGDIHIGYIERGVASFLTPWMDRGIQYSATATAMETKKNNLHPVVVLRPSIPEEAPAEAETVEA